MYNVMIRIVLIALIGFILSASSPEDARKANEAYRNGDYTTAIELYKKAIEDSPDNARLYFNLGNALAKEGRAEEAIRHYEQFKALTDDPGQRALADYNIGNIYSNNQQWDKALTSYKKALRQNDSDFDAKHNYELALNKKQEQEQKQQQENQDQQNQQQNQDQQDQQQQNQQQQNQNQQNQNQQQQQDQNQQSQDQQNQQPNQQQTPGNISKAEAEKILQALEQKEKELLRQFKKQKTESSNSANEKDW